MASKTSDEAPASGSAAPDCKLGILDLPEETQKEIVSHCSQGDLICLSLVNKHFRELAAAQLYRNFHIVFPDEDDPSYDSPIDGLAGGLDTFVTSDYNYAQHLKDLSLDTLSAGHKAEAAYKPYLFSVSCGKFMNTLLLMTLRKATTLETFRWNIRVELSRPVYKALHQINTLRHVHVRLQAGPSLYEAPPPLPFTSTPPSTYPPVAMVGHMPDIVPPPPPPPGFGMAPPPSLFYVAPPITSAPPPPLPKPPARVKIPKKTSRSKEPPTLSGFKDLKSLSVLDIDSLDIITEIKTCVRNSSGTLTKLKLSFSDALASQARKPPPDLDPEDSDPDDEFQVVPVPNNTSPPYMDDVSGPAKVFRAQEEKKSQEAVLGRIFDVEPYMVKKSKRRITEKIIKEAKEEPTANAGTDFIDAIKAMSNKLMKELNGAGSFNMQQQEILDVIEAAARKYVAAEEAKGTTTTTTTTTTTGKDDQKPDGQKEEGGTSASAGPASSSNSQQDAAAKDSAEQSSQAGDLFSTNKTTNKVKDADKDVSPDDIIIEEPEEQLAIETPEGPGGASDNQPLEAAPPEAAEVTPAETPPPPPPPKNPLALPNGKMMPPNVGKAIFNLEAQKHNFKTLADKLETYEAQVTRLNDELLGLRTADGSLDLARIEDAEKQMQSFSRNIMEIQNEMHIVEAEIDDAEKQIPQVISDATAKSAEDAQASQQRRISEYVRSTRGMGLRTLSIHLIPVKASILSKAVDIRVLKSITLLNVGHQAPIWSLFAKENKQSPLALRKIVTDNVSLSFLNFVSQLEEVHDLFMLERDTKYKPESFAPKSNVTMDMIRPRVLRKHIHCLKRLMIKNLCSQDWDLDEKTTLLIARRGRNLEELAVSLNIRAIHTLMQQISGLVNLRALHVIQLRNDDTCVWVMRETKRFLVDNLSHHPDLKLEWVSIDDDACAERILRPSEVPKKTKKKKSKGKEKATVPFINGNNPFPPLPPIDAWDAVDESEDEDEDLQTLKLETIEGVHFSDVWGVRIFKKEVTWGRL